MSQWLGVTATRKAWEAKVKTSTQRLMLLAIAKYADGDCKAFPSVASLCADTFLNPKTAFKVLKELKGLGLITVEKRPTNNRNQYVVCGGTTENGTTENGTTKNGTTKNGTTKNGTTKNGTTVIPKTEQPVIPKTVYEEYQGINQEEKQSIPPPSPAAKREAQTHRFSLSEIPDAWKDYIEAVRPDLDPKKVFTDFRFYWENGRGSSTRRSDKGWTQSWQTWVRREKEAQRREGGQRRGEEFRPGEEDTTGFRNLFR